MSDLKDFYEMTKPMKFRRVKLAKMMIVLWYKDIRERIKYLYNYILYKLKILELYSYRDNVENTVPVEVKEVTHITTNNFKATVVMKMVTILNIDTEYFHRKGKITYTVRDKRDYERFFVSSLDDTYLKVEDSWISLNNRPVFKYCLFKPEPVAYVDVNEPIKPIEPEVLNLDLTKINKVYSRYLHSRGDGEVKPVTEAEIEYFYTLTSQDLTDYLSVLTLKDLII